MITSKRYLPYPSIPQSINPLQTLYNPTLEQPPPNSSLERWCRPDWPFSAITPHPIPTNHILDWKKEEYEKDGGGYLDKNGNLKNFLEGYRSSSACVTWLCRFPEIHFGPNYDVHELEWSYFEMEEIERINREILARNPLLSMYPLLNGEPQGLPAYVRYGRKCHSYIDVPCDDDEFPNESAATPAILNTPLTSARCAKSASKQKWKTKKISVTSRSFRLADHSLVCSWCMTTFEGSQANAEKHMKDFHGHQVKVLSLPPPPPDAHLQNQDRRATLRPKPHRLRQQSPPQEETRYACPWPFDNECSLQAQKKTLGSMDEMVRHMAGAHIGPTFFCHLCHWYCWEKKAVLEHPKYCRGLSGIRFRELQNRQWDQIRDSILNGGTKFKGSAPSNFSPSAGNAMQK